MGRRPDGKPWRVAIERPLPDRREMLRAIPLKNASISTAGDYRKYFEHGGRRYSHIIDPTTGRPVEHTLGSVTVVADTCLAADGWDTPLLVLGPVRGFKCAEDNGIAALFVSASDGAESVRTTRKWRDRFGEF
jgi:thiamine biosynthesis lipoprotein